jgi:hypothetical protein
MNNDAFAMSFADAGALPTKTLVRLAFRVDAGGGK